MKIPFIRYSKVWLGIAALTMTVCVAMIAAWGLKPGIDFTGGSLLEVSFSKSRPETAAIEHLFDKLGLKERVVQKTGENGFIIRSSFLTEEQHQATLKSLREAFQTKDNALKEESFETIGAAISQQLRQRSLWAIILVNLSIIAYLAYAFRKVSRPVQSWKYGLFAIVALVHDVLLVLGVFAALGHFRGTEIDTAFIVAILTVLGYSVNDTIVVYDRIRENLVRHSAENFPEIVNNGLNDTLMRSLNTTFTVLLPLFALFFLGGATIHTFALALLIGMASGAYSSIFIASPLLVMAEQWQKKK